MKISNIVFSEIKYNPTNFLLALAGVFIAVSSVVGIKLLISGYQLKSKVIYEEKYEKIKSMLEEAEEQYRKSTLELGFNVLIVPKDQNISDFYADDFVSKYMPEEYVEKLGQNKLVTVNHLFPTLTQKIHWPEKERTIVLTGTRGEVAIAQRNQMKPMQEAVPPGKAVVGYYLAQQTKIKPGDEIILLGKKFTVSEILSERGTRDDIGIWIDLAEAQELLNKKGLINAIFAIECKCGWANIDKVREELGKILPDTQILGTERKKAKSRAEIRSTAEKITQEALQDEMSAREKNLSEIKRMSRIAIPAVIVASAAWIAFISFSNASARRYEVALLASLGVPGNKINMIFLLKSLLIGVIGTALGIFAGMFVGISQSGIEFSQLKQIIVMSFIVWVFFLSVAISLLCAWAPAMVAIRARPAEILRES